MKLDLGLFLLSGFETSHSYWQYFGTKKLPTHQHHHHHHHHHLPTFPTAHSGRCEQWCHKTFRCQRKHLKTNRSVGSLHEIFLLTFLLYVGRLTGSHVKVSFGLTEKCSWTHPLTMELYHAFWFEPPANQYTNRAHSWGVQRVSHSAALLRPSALSSNCSTPRGQVNKNPHNSTRMKIQSTGPDPESTSV